MATLSVEPVFLLWLGEGSDNRPGTWYEQSHFVPLYSAQASDGIDALVDSKTYDTKPSHGSPNRHWTFKTGVHTVTKDPGCSMVKGLEKTGQDPEESNKNKTQPSEQCKSRSTKRGCLEQFGFLSEPSSLKKQKKEDLPKTLVSDEKKTKPVAINAANVASPQVLSQLSKGEEKKKTSNHKESRVRNFQWNWLTLFPWLRINMQSLNSDEQYSYPKPQVQLRNCVVQSMFCDACSQLAKTSSGADISKKSGTKVFKIETLKKHEKSQAHVSCTKTLKARQNPQESPLAKSNFS